jgi:hypothetical protein
MLSHSTTSLGTRGYKLADFQEAFDRYLMFGSPSARRGVT